jgi:predicted TPR repeat methyltransferase
MTSGADKVDTEKIAEAYNRGLALEKSGDLAGAAEAYRQVLALDPDDHGGVSIRLAAMGRGGTPDKMPDAYVTTLFDQHADDFDDILVEQLHYCVPLLLREQLRRHADGRFDRVLDLGCGTGLTGMALADCAAHITGVDLSERIVELAFDRGVYDDLYVGEAVAFLREFEEEGDPEPRWNLIAATDVFPYLGDAEPVIAAAVRRLVPQGLFGFSTETLDATDFAGRDYRVGPDRRFAHDPAYIRRSLNQAGFDILAMDDITVRLEEGQPVLGHLVLARSGR